MTRVFSQSRIKANSPDEAALKIRGKHKEYKGGLHLKLVPGWKDWFEYCIEVKLDED